MIPVLLFHLFLEMLVLITVSNQACQQPRNWRSGNDILARSVIRSQKARGLQQLDRATELDSALLVGGDSLEGMH